jgi:hypothetical protein
MSPGIEERDAVAATPGVATATTHIVLGTPPARG